MSEKAASREQWGSRFGYVMATIGMAVGLGAIWRFPMIAAQNGGGAFVLAYIIMTVVIAIPAGWAEIAFGRWAQSGPVEAFGKKLGKPGRVIGGITSLVPLGLNMYYLIIVGWVCAYMFFSITGNYFAQPVEFFQTFEANKTNSFLWTIVVTALTAVICYKGIKGGIEKFCKFALPFLYVVLVCLAVRICMLPGIAEGIEFYIRPDFSALRDPQIWLMAGSMAFFAIGLGPAFLLVYGSYLDKKADVTFDYLTVVSWNIMGCVLAGFVTVPAVVLFNLDKATGAGLVFQVMPNIFRELAGGKIIAFAFFTALFFAAISTTISIMEITVAGAVDAFKMNRKKAVLLVAAATLVGAIPCVLSDGYLDSLDWVVNNIGYNFSAAFTAILLAWFVGAKKVREEWLNPSSAIKLGGWYDVVFKFIVCPVLLFLCFLALKELFIG